MSKKGAGDLAWKNKGQGGGERGTGLRRKGPHFPKSKLSPQEIAKCLGVSSRGVRGGGVPWRIECVTLFF